jgi:hypothetical protein
MAFPINRVAGWPAADWRVVPVARGTLRSQWALSQWCDYMFTQVVLSYLTAVPCSNDETRIGVSEDTGKKKKSKDVTPCHVIMIGKITQDTSKFGVFLFLLVFMTGADG